MHLGVGGRPDIVADELTELRRRHPSVQIGYALPRREPWEAVAARLREALSGTPLDAADGSRPPLRLPPGAARSMAAALPPDDGIIAYLRQLDVEQVLVAGKAEPASFAADYAAACRTLGLACASLGATPEAARAQAARPGRAPSDVVGLSARFWRLALWALRGRELLTHPPQDDMSLSDADRRKAVGLPAKLGEFYARSVFPEIAAVTVRLAPASRPLLKARLKRSLNHEALTTAMSAEAAMARAAQGEGPVLVGPWTGDAESELLYWIPFLRWCRRRYRIDKERIVAVSSGDCGVWYEGLGSYLDLSELFDGEALQGLERDRRLELERRAKRFGVTDADRQIFKRLDRRLGLRGFNLLPSWVMRLLFEAYLRGEAGPSFVAEHTRYVPLKIKEKRARQLHPELPARFLAMSFEGSAGLPEGAQTRAFAAQLVREAARFIDVAVVVSQGRADALRPQVGEAPGVHWIELEPSKAKGQGSIVAAGAEAFLGAQNWLAYAAASLGKPVVCFQSEPELRQLIDRVTVEIGFDRAPIVLAPDPDGLRRALQLIGPAGEAAALIDDP